MKNNTLILAEGQYTGILKNVIETDHFIVSTTQYEASKCNSTLHSHKNPHMCLLFQGADIECKKDLVPYQRVTGDIYFYKAEEKHGTIDTIKDSKNINIEFKIDKLKETKIPFALNLGQTKNPTSQLLLIKMLYELIINDRTSPESLEAMAFQLFDFDNDSNCNNTPNWVKRMDDYLNEYWADDFSLIDLANVIGVHPITISKSFKKYYTCTYGNYRRMLKINKSLSFIKNSEMSLSEIAYACGFFDQSHFIKSFKRYATFLPKDFRRL